MLITRWAAQALFIAAVPIFLLLTNVRIAAVEPRVYRFSLSQYSADVTTGIGRPQLDRAAEEISAYFQNGRELLAIQVRVDGRDEALFNPREVAHMRDVKLLFQRFFHIHELAFVYIVGYVSAVYLWSRERSSRRLAQQLVLAGTVTGGVMATAALSMLVGFDALFTQFHLLSFSNDFWQLDPNTDHLVQMFPQGFWFDVSLGVGALTLLEGGLVALAGLGFQRWTNRSLVARREPPRPLAPDGA